MFENGKLRPDLAAKGVRHVRFGAPSLTFTYFNMEDPVVGGYSNAQIALRRAIAMGFNVDEMIRVLFAGNALPANHLLPPGVNGHDPKLPPKSLYDPAGARALLDRFGFKDVDGDGYRETPEGKPLTVVDRPEQLAERRQDLRAGARLHVLSGRHRLQDARTSAGQRQPCPLEGEQLHAHRRSRHRDRPPPGQPPRRLRRRLREQRQQQHRVQRWQHGLRHQQCRGVSTYNADDRPARVARRDARDGREAGFAQITPGDATLNTAGACRPSAPAVRTLRRSAERRDPAVLAFP